MIMKSENLVLFISAALGLVEAVASQTTEESVGEVLLGRNKACDLLIVIDSPLYERHDRNLSLVVQLAQDHVDGLNDIFASEVFIDDYSDLYFSLKRVQVAFGTCDSPHFEEGYDTNCTQQRSNYLKSFDDATDTHQFCLGYILTYLDFHNGTAGLASIGTMCRAKQNTGFVTMLNFAQERGIEESVITFAHEVGHNFNAIHDNDFTDDPDCFNQGYIMDEVLNETMTENHKKFSKCSIEAMHKALTNTGTSCFKDIDYDMESIVENIEIALCGNNIVEPGEECDCGHTIEVCDDPCCYPAKIPDWLRSANHSARPCSFNTRSQCLHSPAYIFGFYLPWAVIAFSVVTLAIVSRQKLLYGNFF